MEVSTFVISILEEKFSPTYARLFTRINNVILNIGKLILN